MARLTRAEILDPSEVAIAHIMNRTVRRCFLFGDDPVSGENFDHRKVWIEKHLPAAERLDDLILLAHLGSSGHLKPIISRQYPVEEAVAAHRHVDSGRNIGNIAIQWDA
ncbi:hypothetical protein Enr13x_28130 [Stieleria neptunia]|uniref:Uncharacterized protein n=1 Tax=Stieleria neptunia TaxID=2527979 RepID=A0A518HQ59_9BACT|nr:zinc-binding dehydrogenase [Stieleria neptunia]QDV42961.1 hypothetical protein Enr13x_28130 [Stieleria neptunia]